MRISALLKQGFRSAVLTLALMCVMRSAAAQITDSSAFKVSNVIAPSICVVGGVAIHEFAHHTWDSSIRDFAGELRRELKVIPFDDYIQYLPAALDLSVGLLGGECENDFTGRLVEGAIAYAVSTALVWTGKLTVNSLRPNGRDSRSFPSGHTAVAFTGAELVRLEYGWEWGLGAYIVAAAVGGMRIYRNYHWLSDVLAGAGVGILSANIGKWLLDPACGMLGVSGDGASFSLRPSVDPVSGMLVPSLALNF